MLDGWNYVHVCLAMAKLHQNFHTTKKNPQNFLRIDGVENGFEAIEGRFFPSQMFRLYCDTHFSQHGI